ncbi:hypothetical protein N7523_004041 [Penicillium sp. IBT 18751x]|nr:hypothetical protein N7523_004041 [Penicillium sp. IBT 18751x]
MRSSFLIFELSGTGKESTGIDTTPSRRIEAIYRHCITLDYLPLPTESGLRKVYYHNYPRGYSKGPQHIDTVDRLIIHLYSTRFRAIKYGFNSGIDLVQLSSDASYGDHPDRYSSAGYLIQVYGGLWKRLLNRISFILDYIIAIQCDNKRTVNLLTKEEASFDTKLKYIDIYHYWLR